MVIKENLDYESALKLYIRARNCGISIERGASENILPATSSASSLSVSHLLGYLAKLNDEETLKLRASAIYHLIISENGFRKHMKRSCGIYGVKSEVNATGHKQSVLAEEPPKPGKPGAVIGFRGAKN